MFLFDNHIILRTKVICSIPANVNPLQNEQLLGGKPMSEQFTSMTIAELRKYAQENAIPLRSVMLKKEIIECIIMSLVDKQQKQAKSNENSRIQTSLDIATPEQNNFQNDSFQVSQPIKPIRQASIITDDEQWDDDNSYSMNAPPRQVLTRQSQPASMLPVEKPSSSPLDTISSKAPAFTMEGARAWHNPKPTTQMPFQSGATRNGWSRQAPNMATSQQRQPSPSRQPSTRTSQPPYHQSASRFSPEPVTDPQGEYRPRANVNPVDSRNQNAQSMETQRDYQPYDANLQYHAKQDLPAYQRDNPPPSKPIIQEILNSSEVPDSAGILEIHSDGFGFLRTVNFLPSREDVYVSHAQIRRFRLKTGDFIEGKTRPQREGDRFPALLYVSKVNGTMIEDLQSRNHFNNLTILYPQKRMTLSTKESKNTIFPKLDSTAPLGYGQRLLVNVHDEADVALFMKQLTDSIQQKHPKVKQHVLTIGQRPEERALLESALDVKTLHADMDESVENQVRLSELLVEHLKRLVEVKQDVLLFIDDLMHLVNAYHLVTHSYHPMTPFAFSPNAINRVNKLLCSARATKESGSLTIVAFVKENAGKALSSELSSAILSSFNAKWYFDDVEFSELNEKSDTIHKEKQL